MNITVTKLTDKSLMDKACSFTAGHDVEVRSMKKMYLSEHSPIRTALFWVEMHDIPTFVSVHLARHKIWVEHYVKSNRPDRGGDEESNRHTPVNHAMLLNAQALINMARKRLCSKASVETQEVMRRIKQEVAKVDPELAECMVEECLYRRGCYEFQSCGRWRR